jgi:hypothetical protein
VLPDGWTWDLQQVQVFPGQGALRCFYTPITTLERERSGLGRDILVVTIGDGPTPVMLIANQHGNEFIVSRGMMDLIHQVAGDNSPERQAIRDALTVTIVPASTSTVSTVT